LCALVGTNKGLDIIDARNNHKDWRSYLHLTWFVPHRGFQSDIFVLKGVKKERNILKKQKEGRLTGLGTSCVGTAFWNTLLKDM